MLSVPTGQAVRPHIYYHDIVFPYHDTLLGSCFLSESTAQSLPLEQAANFYPST